ncbi:MAG: osmoprotectant transport system substrate-binding protein [Actinomycetota bacterium]|jgi:osmoprotectant transport system substrate-binding protein|nr:osmoprotectant transport system substrate-binding protein [Actinomycetota bacterium]
MRKNKSRLFVAALVGLALVAGACGDDNESGGVTDQPKGSVTIGGFNFPESAILSHIYAGALRNEDFTTTVRANLGSREVVAPALEKGDIDAYLGYAATDLEFYNNDAGQATPDAKETVDKLNDVLQPKGLLALDPSPAIDQNAFGVTQATADKYKLTKLSDLEAVAGELRLGGPPECPIRPFCAKGLEDKYKIKFKEFKALDAGGPLTKTALRDGDIEVALLFTSDAKGFVLLEDDKKLQNADAVVPIVKADNVLEAARAVMNDVSAKLTSADLSELNERVSVGKEDPDVVADSWLSEHGFKK